MQAPTPASGVPGGPELKQYASGLPATPKARPKPSPHTPEEEARYLSAMALLCLQRGYGPLARAYLFASNCHLGRA
jgi:hypothetical protein